ncbi:MAG: helix-turn-helix domain-containing protein, partial [Bermanella sp.]
ANRFAEQQTLVMKFDTAIVPLASILTSMKLSKKDLPSKQRAKKAQANNSRIVILPPDISGKYFLTPDEALCNWILTQHKQGAIICSACAGTFILAETGLLNHRPATTHWNLAEQLSKKYLNIQVNSEKILINDGDLITAGGLMSWLDLGLELVAQFMQPAVMRQLGKFLVVDTAPREQRYYRSFKPKMDHGDKVIYSIQHFMQSHYSSNISVMQLSEKSHLSERTFSRHFVGATGLNANEYLQRIRIQKACELLETSTHTFETIAYNVGYEDVSACRKAFIKIVGLTPRDFKARFI